MELKALEKLYALDVNIEAKQNQPNFIILNKMIREW
jgi:hypothetical protein